MSKDNRPQLSAVPSPRSEQHLCHAKTIWTAAINGPDKLQLFSCLSNRRERERFVHGWNMVLAAAIHMLDLSPIWQELAISRALCRTLHCLVRRIRVAYALTSMSEKPMADQMDSASDLTNYPLS